jgi:hypothetical protein
MEPITFIENKDFSFIFSVNINRENIFFVEEVSGKVITFAFFKENVDKSKLLIKSNDFSSFDQIQEHLLTNNQNMANPMMGMMSNLFSS